MVWCLPIHVPNEITWELPSRLFCPVIPVTLDQFFRVETVTDGYTELERPGVKKGRHVTLTTITAYRDNTPHSHRSRIIHESFVPTKGTSFYYTSWKEKEVNDSDTRYDEIPSPSYTPR